MAIGRLAGPAGLVFGGITGALVGVLLGGAAGSAAGAVLGNAIDEHVLDNHECQSCGHRFSLHDAPAALEPVAGDTPAPSPSRSNRSVSPHDALRSTFKSDHSKE